MLARTCSWPDWPAPRPPSPGAALPGPLGRLRPEEDGGLGADASEQRCKCCRCKAPWRRGIHLDEAQDLLAPRSGAHMILRMDRSIMEACS